MGFSSCKRIFSVVIIGCCYCIQLGVAKDTITASQFVKDPDTISSSDGNFTLGFFSPQNSTNRYVGIWIKSKLNVIWVANRNRPLNDSSGTVTISEDGNLVVQNGQKQVIWSSNVSNIAANTTSQLLVSGDLVLLENRTGNTLWESFQHPSDAYLPNMKLTSNKNTGEKVELTSWKSPSDPSVGSFSLSPERLKTPEVFIWNETRPYWRSGPWNGGVFTGIPVMSSSYLYGFRVGDDGRGTVDMSFSLPDESEDIILVLNSQGQLQQKEWDDVEKEWQVTWNSAQSGCDVYGTCGAFASCNSQSSPICSCLRGFEPTNMEEWKRQNWTSGCVRKNPLQCQRASNRNTSVDSEADGFLKLSMIKVPDFAEWSSFTEDTCRSQCLGNCSCIAYSYDAAIGCMSWNGNLIDIQQFSSGGLDLYIRVPNTDLDKGRKTTVLVTITVTIGTVIAVTCAYVIWRRTSKHPGGMLKVWHSNISARENRREGIQRINKSETSAENTSDYADAELSEVKFQDLLLLNFLNITTATNNFHESSKLGQGGFGPVYKGKLQDGQEIAVKRLSKASGQGLEQFMNEVVVISKLQHRNLVRLLGCCVEGDEKMLIYEYMPNKSLDAFVFDQSKSKLLDWRKRFNIIEGIARGLLYLHRDSRLKIIHRDLKASNILLDEELNPKISDFGMAKIFGGNEDRANTNRVVGTYGYMSPEYAMQGFFSEKSDVFSFGVLLLEIVSGRKNSSFYDNEDSWTLLGFAWRQWMEDNVSSLIDPGVYDLSLHKDILRCIHIGLLCVQEHATDRPTMAAVISMLNSEIVHLPPPKQPAFVLRENMLNSESSNQSHGASSINNISITDINGR